MPSQSFPIVLRVVPGKIPISSIYKIRLGYDPRSDPMAAKYQIFDIVVRDTR